MILPSAISTICACPSPTFATCAAATVCPVSYTHLDVYKRQAPDSAEKPQLLDFLAAAPEAEGDPYADQPTVTAPELPIITFLRISVPMCGLLI